MMHILIDAKHRTEARVQLTYSTGDVIEIDFTPYLDRGGVFLPLRDPLFFSQVTIGERGRFLQWPGDLEFCADALFLQGNKKESDTGD